MGMRSWLAVGCALAIGCASGDGGVGDSGGGGMDAGPFDAGNGGDDAGADSGMRGSGLSCEVCETNADCAVDHYCAPLATGGNVCLARCNIDLPDCAPRFECVMNFTGSIPEPVCAPVGERCCVDFDGDLHGTGVGCLGTDCNDDDMSVNSSASELCDGQDNDCNDMVDDGNQDLLCPRGEHVADSMCAGGMCEIGACEPNFADCNRTAADGCEVSTTGSGDCGMCGTPCTIANGTPDCSSGACRVGTCDPGFGDCNMMAADGCEEPLNTLTDCGACGNTCNLARASETCASGTCEIASCDPGYGDCDLSAASGCETSTRTNADCGSCGTICNPPNATGECSTGTCEVSTCDPGYGDCDFNGTSCESRLNTNANCGRCGTPCSLANASESCASGTCALGSCNSSYSDCDSNEANGCEVGHNTSPTTCSGALDAGSACGDETGGFLCPGIPWAAFSTRTGNTEAWYRVHISECSDCCTDVEGRVTLAVPGGVDYDLYVFRSCGGALWGSSTTVGNGVDETVTVTRSDPCDGNNEDFDMFAEVRYRGGAACAEWTLTFEAH